MAARHADPSESVVRDQVMQAVAKSGTSVNSVSLAKEMDRSVETIVAASQSLESGGFLVRSNTKEKGWVLTDEGKRYQKDGTPESRVYKLLHEGGAQQATAAEKALSKDVVDIARKQLSAQKILTTTEQRPAPGGGELLLNKEFKEKHGEEEWKKAKDQAVVTLALVEGAKFEDKTAALLNGVVSGPLPDAKALADLKKRKLAVEQSTTVWTFSKGPSFPAEFPASPPYPWNVKEKTDFLPSMLQELWGSKDKELPKLKKLNFDAFGKGPEGGHVHPLMTLRQQYREIFLEMGFQEMETNRFVESSFWNFDTLFVPQKHPARDMQDTFFVSSPATTECADKEYEQRVKQEHEGGYKYTWSTEESQKNVLRTHTTAVSAYTLHQIAEDYRKTGKLRTGAYFSIDRVFRNEEMDKTHLCEFHQIEGFVIDEGLSLGHLLALLSQFFEKVGVQNLQYKPTYNPYTEPSMEIHGWHEGLQKVIEVGNSGVFRPEMLRPMGLPENVSVIAWGLGLERPAMMFYKLPSVHDLVGHKVDLQFVKDAAIPRM
eukprot:Hpha_TRINITY_DN16693_c2_g1::TRINITY_DN16693_c2_g1_i1::g.180575::m.180575/K01889/FARSA, pheS; phenylalanyl-tRNA synthetase alpha chain